MFTNYTLTATKRDRTGKGVARALRREGKIPAVIYGDKKEPLTIAMPSNDVNVEFNKGHMAVTLCDLVVDGEKHLVLARDLQLHPVTDVVEHVDFLRVNNKTQIAVMVPVHFVDEDQSPGLSKGGMMNVVRHEVELMVAAMSIPEAITFSLKGKDIGDNIRINDANLPAGVKPTITGRNFIISSIVAPKVAAVEDDAPAEDAGAATTEAKGA